MEGGFSFTLQLVSLSASNRTVYHAKNTSKKTHCLLPFHGSPKGKVHTCNEALNLVHMLLLWQISVVFLAGTEQSGKLFQGVNEGLLFRMKSSPKVINSIYKPG